MTEVTNPITLGKEPAYPQDHLYGQNGDVQWGNTGLTKREYIAAMAMQGQLANGKYGRSDRGAVAEYAVDYADALLAVLAKQS